LYYRPNMQIEPENKNYSEASVKELFKTKNKTIEDVAVIRFPDGRIEGINLFFKDKTKLTLTAFFYMGEKERFAFIDIGEPNRFEEI
jgi:hypothetical protein